jgi:hypothetical protein
MVSGKRVIARLLGNFGISFFSPLVSGNIAVTMFDIGISFNDTLIIAGLSAIFVTGLAMSKELRDWGRSKPDVDQRIYENEANLDSDDIEMSFYKE